MSHEGDGAGNFSHQQPRRLDASYEFGEWKEATSQRTMQLIENNAKCFTRLVGNQRYFDLRSIITSKSTDRAIHTVSCRPRNSKSALTSSQVLLSWNGRQRIRPIGRDLES
ncbi:Uncharacterized protein Adt_11156 [Abeliophyllum distichum]|uniref:Uncharacterized protein n=1 Tax=Abeliophyllum distichum TaxID=126358 RepID=A0ABD1UMG7_9LAMI